MEKFLINVSDELGEIEIRTQRAKYMINSLTEYFSDYDPDAEDHVPYIRFNFDGKKIECDIAFDYIADAFKRIIALTAKVNGKLEDLVNDQEKEVTINSFDKGIDVLKNDSDAARHAKAIKILEAAKEKIEKETEQ